MQLILASSSKSRATLLKRLHIPFDIIAPNIDETALANETTKQLVQRLAKQKAQAVATQYPQAIVIGSDQVAYCDGQILGKPHTYDNAFKQLRWLSGKTVYFQGGLCVLSPQTPHCQLQLITTIVVFRQLSDTLIDDYLQRDQPYHCAGSLRSEGLGIVLCEKISSDDPNALIGLSLIELTTMLNNIAFWEK